jgi:carboxyl-terminal processing protease
VIRASILLMLLFQAPAFAQVGIGDSPDHFDHERAQRVYSTALTFMIPRILEPTPVADMVRWGLGGVAAIDPHLHADLQENTLRLRQLLGGRVGERVLFTRMTKPKQEIRAWARDVADIQEAAFNASRVLRSAGTSAIVQSFFDELFNHLDP